MSTTTPTTDEIVIIVFAVLSGLSWFLPLFGKGGAFLTFIFGVILVAVSNSTQNRSIISNDYFLSGTIIGAITIIVSLASFATPHSKGFKIEPANWFKRKEDRRGSVLFDEEKSNEYRDEDARNENRQLKLDLEMV